MSPRRPLLAVFGILAGCLPLLTALPTARAAGTPARIYLSPAGGTLQVGATLTLTPEAVDANGQVVPNVQFRFRSSSSSVASVDGNGGVTAQHKGSATITCSGGGVSTTAPISVVGQPQGGSYVVSHVRQINDILVDGDQVYWTEVSNGGNWIRRASVNGGGFFTLAQEPHLNSRFVPVVYVQLQLSGDTLFFSRESRGLEFDNWQLFQVPKSATTPGSAAQVLQQNLFIGSGAALILQRWRVVGPYLVAELGLPHAVGLTKTAVFGVYNTATQTWSPLLTTASVVLGRAYITASDDQFLYVTTVRSDGSLALHRVDPAGAPDNGMDTPLFTEPTGTTDYGIQGATDGVNVYLWSRGPNDTQDHLLAVPVAGGSATTLFSGHAGANTVTDGTNVYWVDGTTQKKLNQIPVSGGTVTQRGSTKFGGATRLGSIAVTADSLYVATLANGQFSIVRAAK